MYSKNSPYAIDAKAGDSLYVCQCGKTGNAPFCDGTHKSLSTGVSPREVSSDEDTTIYVCGCGKTENPPFCDGSHKQ